MPKVPEQQDHAEKSEPEKVQKDPHKPRPKGADQKGQNIEQNTRNQGYQQDR